jgi:hypothetical protein
MEQKTLDSWSVANETDRARSGYPKEATQVLSEMRGITGGSGTRLSAECYLP